MAAVYEIRRSVFIDEQGVPPEDEWDDFDGESTHFLALCDGEPAGCVRVRYVGKGVKIERLAVLPDFRGMGVGSALMNYVLEKIPPDHNVYLYAQVDKVAFYERFGFRARGEVFPDGGIPHRAMHLSL